MPKAKDEYNWARDERKEPLVLDEDDPPEITEETFKIEGGVYRIGERVVTEKEWWDAVREALARRE